MYEAINISYSVREKQILHNISLKSEPGSFTAIVGPNGAGKSTLLKAMAHEHTHYSGEVMINGKSVRSYTPQALAWVRAVLPQSSTMQFAFTAGQVVTLGRHGHAAGRRENDQIVEEVMNLTGVHHFYNRNYLTLSGGEKQRVQLARVLAQVWEEALHPRYILLDEPTSSLDIAQQQLIFSLAKRVCERNIGVVAIVHDLNQAILFADHVYFLRDGRVIASGNAQQAFTKANIEETFCCRVNIYHDPCNNCPYIIPERTELVRIAINNE
ncbi:MAG TPA: heme ABC transporter ATP-binding protein [Ohtaekwangia sp.]|uniref:heme ABC transporter ATP-binding protein n=1 Tax=Ohtaekwangia sp. TaxID=2066019 RepID=UPI002F924BD3